MAGASGPIAVTAISYPFGAADPQLVPEDLSCADERLVEENVAKLIAQRVLPEAAGDDLVAAGRRANIP